MTTSAGAQPSAAAGKRKRQPLSESARRVLLGLGGLVVVVASVAGFYYASDAFDERTPVLVAAVDIQKGETISADYLASDSALMGDIPHIPYTPAAPLAFDGLIASQPIPAGAVVLDSMFASPTLSAPGDLEATVSFDTSLLAEPVYNGDTVLLVNPGAGSTSTATGRPSEVISVLTLSNYQDGAMTMFFGPEKLEDWIRWRLLPETIGATPQIVLVPLGVEPAQFAQLMNDAWRLEWEARAALAAARDADLDATQDADMFSEEDLDR